jgi:hypothetical protein
MKIYVSHSIRGKFGATATEEQMAANCKKAVQFGKLLRLNFPQIEWYVPAEHDDFVRRAYQKNYLTESEILDIDCEILKTCNGLLVYIPDDYISMGMQIEISYAAKNNIPHVLIKEQQWDRTREFLEKINV